ncbi:hypothetical protein IQ266_09765, partial [filamentous cyanobacterium LEGE 11480]
RSINLLYCGTKKCSTYTGSHLDRDKDKSDLRRCPTGFYTNGYKKFPQIWPAADVYLRRCRKGRKPKPKPPSTLLCGTRKCKTSRSGLDRDKDKSDLRRCPSGYASKGYKKYPQAWPAADVYLRICRRK